MLIRRPVSICHIFVLLLCKAVVAAPPSYQVIDLPQASQGWCIGRAMNSQGVVVGTFSWQVGHIWYRRGFIWDGQVLTELDTLGGERSQPHAINEVGQVVGYAEVAGGEDHAFLYDAGVMSDLGLTGEDVWASDINDIRQSGCKNSSSPLYRKLLATYASLSKARVSPSRAE